MGHPAESFSLFAPTASDAAGAHRVLHAITPSRYSGAERMLARLVPRLEERGHAVHSICSRRSPVLSEFRAAGIVVESAPIGGKMNLMASRALELAAERFRADLVHTHLSSASWWAGWAERLGGTPSLGHVHGFTSAVWHRQQKHLIAVSHAVKDSLVEQGIEPTKISVLHNAVDPADVQPRRLPALIREELGAAAETPVVGCFAHLSAKKGWLELVRAMPLILRDVPEAQLWCVGDGPLRDTLQDEAEREGVAGRVRFTGFRRDVADLMRAVDVVALPSYREPLGLVYLEAGLLGRPVVGCKAGGAPEVIRDQDSGLLVPPHDSVALAEAISRLLLNRAEARQMGHRGLERARDEFNWSGYLDKLLDVYDIMRN